MNKLLAGFSLALIAANPTIVVAGEGSQLDHMGFMEASYSSSEYNFDDNNWGPYNTWQGMGLAGAVSFRNAGSHSYGMDIRGFGAHSESDSSDEAYNAYALQAAVHLTKLFPDASLGLFAGLTSTNGYYDAGGDTAIFGGVEGKRGLGDVAVLSAQIGVLKDVESVWPYSGEVGFGEAELALFPLQNIRLSASIGGVAGGLGDTNGEDAETLTYGAEAALQVPDAPVSVFVAYAGYKDFASWQDEGVQSGGTLSIGAKFSFGSGSLREEYLGVNQVMNMETVSWLRLDGY